MKICIYGAGATGCTIGAKFFKAGADITLIGRGEHLHKIKENGLQFISKDSEENIKIPCTDFPSSLPKQDYIIIATKAYNIPEIAPNIPQLLHDRSTIIPACNGVPWWFLQGLEGPLKDHRIKALDPKGIIEKHVDYNRIIGGIFYMAASIVKAGVVSNFEGPRFIIGAPDRNITKMVSTLGSLMEKAGFKNPVTDNIRGAIWLKLCWNVAFNPLSVIYEKNCGEMTTNPEIKTLASNIMEEMRLIANKLNIKLNLDIEKHIGLTSDTSSFKPSMLQDYEKGRRMEVEAIIGSVYEIANMLNLETPAIKRIFNMLLDKAA